MRASRGVPKTNAARPKGRGRAASPSRTTSGKSTDSRSRRNSASFDLEHALSNAAVRTVPLAKVRGDDRRHRVRKAKKPATDPGSIVVDHGTVGFTSDHPLVLEPLDDEFRIVNGFDRYEALQAVPDAVRVKCLVLPNESNLATLVAARINLTHGRSLTYKERRECFRREYLARRAANLPKLTDRAWARIYLVSATTIGEWVREFTDGRRSNRQRRSVQSGHATESRNKAARTVDDAIDDLDAATIELCRDLGEDSLTDEQRKRVHSVVARLEQRCTPYDATETAA